MRKFPKRFLVVLNEILKKYPDYSKNSYMFVYEALDRANHRLEQSLRQSMTGAELVKDGMVPLAMQRWGFLAEQVFHFWNLKTGVDVGKVVERLVEFGVFKKEANDNFEDFNSLNLHEMLSFTF